MNRFFISAMLLILSCSLNAQNTISIKGKVSDESTKTGLESATIYLSSPKDSSVVDYTISSKNGSFELKTRKFTTPMIVRASFVGFQDYEKRLESGTSDIDLGNIGLFENSTILGEVVIKSEIPPVRIKNDTLEFNASSFKVSPDANVEKLLEQLPGVEITPEGKIMVNGKEVNQILVNGKPFFGKDGKVATQNLPADLIEKIQVVDTKTKEEEISGDAASSDNKTINLTIAEEKNKGFFGKATAGYGSDERYEASMLLNSFKGEQKVSILASSNNINSIGFSMDEIFDNMRGGGRSSSMYYNDDGSFGINGMNFGGNTGITQSQLAGINYQDKWFKKIDLSGNYLLTNAESENLNRMSRTNLLPDETTYTESQSETDSWSVGHNVSLDFQIKLDSTATIYFSPNFDIKRSRNMNKNFQTTHNELNELLNESNGNTYGESENNSFGSDLYFYKAFKKKGRGISFALDNEISDNDNFSNLISETYFYQGTTPDDIRNQIQYDKTERRYYRTEIRYVEPVTDSIKIGIGVEYRNNRQDDRASAFDFDAGSGRYDELNEFLTNHFESRQSVVYPSAGFNLRKKKMFFNIRMGAEMIQFKNNSQYLGVNAELEKNYAFPKVNSYLSYNITDKKSIYGNYNFSYSLPTARQLLPVEILSNPLNTFSGNENLKPSSSHHVYMNFNNYDWSSRSGFFLYMGGNYTQDAIVASTVFDEDFKAYTTYENVDTNISSYAGMSWSKTFKKDKRSLRFNVGLDGGVNFSQGLTNNELYEATGYRLEPKAGINWSITDLITVAPSYKYSFNTTEYSNYVIDKADNFIHTFKMELTSYWPKKVIFGHDFGYTYNSNIADGFKKDFYLWNVSLGYNFYKDKLLAKVKVYDVLNQNIGVRRTITPTAITDSENTVLRRYVMFSLTYKLEKFGGKKEQDNIFILD